MTSLAHIAEFALGLLIGIIAAQIQSRNRKEKIPNCYLALQVATGYLKELHGLLYKDIEGALATGFTDAPNEFASVPLVLVKRYHLRTELHLDRIRFLVTPEEYDKLQERSVGMVQYGK